MALYSMVEKKTIVSTHHKPIDGKYRLRKDYQIFADDSLLAIEEKKSRAPQETLWVKKKPRIYSLALSKNQASTTFFAPVKGRSRKTRLTFWTRKLSPPLNQFKKDVAISTTGIFANRNRNPSWGKKNKLPKKLRTLLGPTVNRGRSHSTLEN